MHTDRWPVLLLRGDHVCCQVGREAGAGLPSPPSVCSGRSGVRQKRSRADSCPVAARRSWLQPCGRGTPRGGSAAVLSLRHKERPWEGREHFAG